MVKKSAQPPEGTVNVNIAEFTQTRDSVIVALATLQSSVQELSRAYITHANAILRPGNGVPSGMPLGAGVDSSVTDVLAASGFLLNTVGVQPMPVIENFDPGKQKRKRAPHDPNAPKRALTPYFLYMQIARDQISRELGESVRPKEVAEEGTRRWTVMNAAERSIWVDRYQRNLAAYRVRSAAYKSKMTVPSEEEAAAMVEKGTDTEFIKSCQAVAVEKGVTGVVTGEEDEIEEDAVQVANIPSEAEEETSSDEDEDDDEEEAGQVEPEPVKEPTPEPEPEPEPEEPKVKRRKTEKKASKVEKPKESEKEVTLPVVETPKPKKERKTAKKAPEPEPVPEPKVEPVSASKPSSEKKRKSNRKA